MPDFNATLHESETITAKLQESVNLSAVLGLPSESGVFVVRITDDDGWKSDKSYADIVAADSADKCILAKNGGDRYVLNGIYTDYAEFTHFGEDDDPYMYLFTVYADGRVVQRSIKLGSEISPV